MSFGSWGTRYRAKVWLHFPPHERQVIPAGGFSGFEVSQTLDTVNNAVPGLHIPFECLECMRERCSLDAAHNWVGSSHVRLYSGSHFLKLPPTPSASRAFR